MKMEDPRKTYAETLGNLARLYNEFVLLIEQESDAIVKRDVTSLEKLARAEEKLLEEIRDAENRRVRFHALVGEAIGVKAEGMSLGEIAEVAGEQYRGIYLGLRAELQEAATRLAGKNKLKMLLCKNSLEHVHNVIRLLSGGEETGTYTPRGVKRSQSGQLLIDQRA